MLILIMIMRLFLTLIHKMMLMLKDLWHNFGVATVERKWEERVDENADKLNHLQSGQIPERGKQRYLQGVFSSLGLPLKS